MKLFEPCLDIEAIERELGPVWRSGWIGLGPKVAEFEKAVAKYLGVREFVATSSGTAALHLAVRSLGLPKGSLVATTPITFVATNMALLYEGLRPVFVDVDPRTGNIAPESLRWLLQRQPIRAIMVVHLAGYPARMAPIMDEARFRGIPVIEDCAHAFGSTYRTGEPLGSLNNLCCFSFHAVKNLPLGDGGGISTNNPSLATRLRRQRWFGISKSTADRTAVGGYSWQYDVEELGFKYHMNDITASIGLAMLPKIEEHNAHRRAIAEVYRTLGEEHQPAYATLDVSACHFYPVFFENRDEVAAKLNAAGIQTGMHYRRNDEYGPFREFTRELPGAEWYQRHELTLPIHPGMSLGDAHRVCDAILS